MRPDKRLETPAQRKSVLAFPDFARVNTLHAEKSLSGRDAPEILNFSVNRRALSDGRALEDFATLSGEMIADLFVYRRYDQTLGRRRDSLVARCRSGKCYARGLYDGGAFAEIPGLTIPDKPVAVNYRLNGEDVLVLCSPAAGMKVWDGSAVRSAENAPQILSACVHYERLFVTVAGEKNAVWFSDDLDITNWDVSLEGAGFIEMADDGGAILKTVSFAGRVYLFRRYSVARLTAYADQTEFELATLYASSGRILEDTVCVCGDRVMFAAQNGLFIFDGVSTTRVLERLDGILDYGNAAARGCYWNGIYILSAYRPDGRGVQVFYDVNTGEEFLFDCGEVACLCPVNTEGESSLFAVTALRSSTVCRVVGEDAAHPGPEKRYRSKTVSLGRRARIARARLDTARPVTFRVVTEEGEESFSLPAGNSEVKCALKGREVRFEIEAQGAGHLVYPPEFDILTL